MYRYPYSAFRIAVNPSLRRTHAFDRRKGKYALGLREAWIAKRNAAGKTSCFARSGKQSRDAATADDRSPSPCPVRDGHIQLPVQRRLPPAAPSGTNFQLCPTTAVI